MPERTPPPSPTAAEESLDARRRVIEDAADLTLLAPSVHDTRPWRIELHDDRLDLRADWTRQLIALDPRGRELVMSAGAALINARVALAAAGWSARCDRLPRPDDPALLAWLWPVAGSPDGSLALLAPSVARRHTNRHRFLPDQVPDDVLRRLTSLAAEDGALLVPAVTEMHRRLLAPLTQGGRLPADTGSGVAAMLLVLATPDDEPLSWLRAGEATQRLLLELTSLGWVAEPMRQVIEVPVTRTQVRAALTWDAHPQVLLRVGRPAPTPRAPRRR